MPALPAAEPRSAELSRALDATGEKELRRMARAARMAHGRFHLFPVESDFTPALRDAFLDRLRDDLAANGLRLRVVALTRDCWNALAALEQEAPINPGDVVMLTGLESTPGIVREAGAKPQRPPALAALNQQREILRQQIAAPLFVWCPTYAYTALLEHAPDFFDQYTAKFHVTSAAPFLLTEVIDIGLKFSFAIDDAFIDKPSYGSQAAVDFCRKQVAAHPNPTYERAVALLNLVIELLQSGIYERSTIAPEAKAYTQEALHLLAKRRDKQSRFLWSASQFALGLIHTYFLSDDRNTDLRQAITCFKASLRVRTEINYPKQWALTQYHLGDAYAKLPRNKGDVNLQHAIACYEVALRVYSEADYPAEWARTQYGLGWAYSHLLSGSQQTNAERATACCEAALHVFTKAEYPTEWADTQIQLGIANFTLAINNGIGNLRKSIASCEAVLRVYNQANHPQIWAITCSLLGTLFKSVGDIPNAVTAFQKAARGYSDVGDIGSVQKMETEIRELANIPTSPTP